MLGNSGCKILSKAELPQLEKLGLIENGRGGTYRAVYRIKFREAVFVLHVFQKKSKHGIATPKPDLDIIRERLKIAEQMVKEMRDA